MLWFLRFVECIASNFWTTIKCYQICRVIEQQYSFQQKTESWWMRWILWSWWSLFQWTLLFCQCRIRFPKQNMEKSWVLHLGCRKLFSSKPLHYYRLPEFTEIEYFFVFKKSMKNSKIVQTKMVWSAKLLRMSIYRRPQIKFLRRQ